MRISSVVALLITASAIIVPGVEMRARLPRPARVTLARRFPGWRFVESTKMIRSFLTERVSPKAVPSFIEGDFDGDGRDDFAVHIIHYAGKVRNQSVVALLTRRNSVSVRVLESDSLINNRVNNDIYLTLGKKGSKGYDFNADKRFRYANDVIEVWYFEKAGWAYIFEKGKFRQIYTAD